MLNEKIKPERERGWAVDKGKRRSHNEDSVAGVELTLNDGDVEKSVGIYALADGVGGESYGEVASNIAVHTVTEKIMEQLNDSEAPFEADYETWLRNAVEAANQEIYLDYKEMATTLVTMILVDQMAYIANVGDSRAYRLDDDGMQQVTEDQSMVQVLVNAGVIQEDEAVNHPYKNVLNQAVGDEEIVLPDFYITALEEGGYLLLCSDGLTNELDDNTIYSIVMNSSSPQEACDELIEQANLKGGRDNISVLIVAL